jgi:hypothetical protein
MTQSNRDTTLTHITLNLGPISPSRSLGLDASPATPHWVAPWTDASSVPDDARDRYLTLRVKVEGYLTGMVLHPTE